MTAQLITLIILGSLAIIALVGVVVLIFTWHPVPDVLPALAFGIAGVLSPSPLQHSPGGRPDGNAGN